jgi:uncharacterized protein (TIGR02452 family)
MNRIERAAVAADTIRISAAGTYTGANEEHFDIREACRRSVENTEIIDPDAVTGTGAAESRIAGTAESRGVTEERSRPTPLIEVVDAITLDAAHAVLMQTGLTPAILNFASAKHPGGGFQGGSLAQEEDIAYRSDLYAALSSRPEYYRESLGDLRGGLYFDKMIYTKGLVVIRDAHYTLQEPWTCDCITAPAPNRGAARSKGIPEDEIDRVLERRINNILKLLVSKGAEVPILGAFGCGVFKNDPHKVAGHFRKALIDDGYGAMFPKIIFAIPGQTNENHKVFRRVFF